MKVLMIDNYDSFTYNLVQYLGELGAEVEVLRNDQVSVEDVVGNNADYIMISPGPCTPKRSRYIDDGDRGLGRGKTYPRSLPGPSEYRSGLWR